MASSTNISTCRTCLKTSKRPFNYMYSTLGNDKLISDILMEETSIKVFKEDGLPTTICDSCLRKLYLVREFRALVIDSDIKLHDSNKGDLNLEDSNNVNIKVEVDDDGDEAHDPLSDTSNNIRVDNFVDVNRLDDSSAGVSGFIQEKQGRHASENVKIKDEYKEGEGLIDEHGSSEKMFMDDESDMEDDLETHQDENSDDKNHDDDDEEIPGENNRLRTLPEHAFAFLEIDPERGIRQKRVFCKLCDRSFVYGYYFSSHLSEHTGYKPYVCDTCGKSFPQRFLLRMHIRNHTEERPYICDTCGKTFKRQCDLINHKPVHSDEKLYKCEQCGKSFKTSDTLKQHLPRHDDEKNHICELCGKTVSNRSDLINHMKTHNERTLPCPTCGKCFKSTRFMKKHIDRIHLKVKNHVCDICDKRFYSLQSLRGHRWIHTGERPYSCKICGKTFRQDSCVFRHMRVHTGETPYSCDICSAKFKYSQHHLKHMKSHEKNDIDKDVNNE